MTIKRKLTGLFSSGRTGWGATKQRLFQKRLTWVFPTVAEIFTLRFSYKESAKKPTVLCLPSQSKSGNAISILAEF